MNPVVRETFAVKKRHPKRSPMPSTRGRTPKLSDSNLNTTRTWPYGYDRLGDVDFLNAGEVSLEHYLDPAFPEKHPLGGENGESKPSAMSHRALCRFCGALSRADRLGRFEYQSIKKRAGTSVSRENRKPRETP